jgi:uncharacterized membrane protein
MGVHTVSEKCDICGAGVANNSCHNCGKNVCSSCIDDNDLLCKICRKSKEMEGLRIGFAPLRNMVNLPLFVIGIAIIITGMVIMTWASFASFNVDQMPQQRQPSGFIYIFPLPFVFAWGSPDAAFTIPIIITAIILPIVIIFLMFRNFLRSY